MSIERGRIKKVNDANIPDSVEGGAVLTYNEATQKWEPKISSTQSIGTPSDGQWSDGLSNWDEETKVADAFDDLNEIIAQLAPANALSMQNIDIIGGPVVYTGKIPNGLDLNWTVAGKVPGDTITTAVKTTKGNFTLANNTTTFNYADKGLLKLYINNTLKATIDLSSNFNEANRKSSQNIAQYNVQGNGSSISAGTVTFAEGSITITSVAKYNNFSYWQKGNVSVVINQELAEGYNNIYLVHELPTGNQISKKLELYYDNDNTTMGFAAVPTVTENAVVGKYLSGVKYYTIGDSLNINYSIDNTFKKIYHPTKVSDYSMPGISTTIKNPSVVPNYLDQMVINDVATINASNIMTNNAVLTAKGYDPYGASVTASSINEGRLILTYPDRSTDKAEYFTDEIYRLPSNYNFNSYLDGVKNNWNSSLSLTNGNALCYLNGSSPALVYPQTNFTTNFLPSNIADYSSFAGDQVYNRAFVATTPQSSVKFTLTGLNGVLAPVGQGDINIEVKLPGLSGWGDALKAYDSTEDKTQDGWGMLSGSVSGGVFTATFGGFSTINSGNRIYVRITLRTANGSVSSIVVGW